MATKNKVKYNLKNAHYALLTFADDTPIYGPVKRWPGAVSISLDANGEIENFYADGIAYYIINNNQGYSGDFESAMIPEDFETDCLGAAMDEDGVIVENANAELAHFAFLFEFDGDAKAIRHCLYNCAASRPTVEGNTNEESKTVQTDTLTINATPLPNGVVKAKTSSETNATRYNGWYDSVSAPDVEFAVGPNTITVPKGNSGTVNIGGAGGTVTASVKKSGTTSTDLTVLIIGAHATITAGSSATGNYTVTFTDGTTTADVAVTVPAEA